MLQKSMTVLILGVLVVLGSASPAAARHDELKSGIKGKVEATVCEMSRSGRQRCDARPVSATIAVRNESNQEVARFTTDKRGKFKIWLPSGNYRFQDVTDGRNVIPGNLMVQEKKFTRATLFLFGNIQTTFGS